jgi:hypothetical protein
MKNHLNTKMCHQKNVQSKILKFALTPFRWLKFDIQAYFNPTKRTMREKNEDTPQLPPPPLTLNMVKNTNRSSRKPVRLKFEMQAYYKLI